MSIDEERLKEVLKEALVEVFEQRKDLFYDIVAEVVEDIALINAIKEGEVTDAVSKAEILKILEGEA
jgi:hypothetical protein